MATSADQGRRALVLAAATVPSLLGAAACGGTRPEAHGAAGPGGKATEDVAATEDLMREHGVLARLLLLYEAAIERVAAEPGLATALHEAAGLVSTFIQQYHEKLEEDFVFPQLERAQRHVDTVTTLRAQHAAGRSITANVLRLTSSGSVSEPDALSRSLRAFVRMYRPHAAREDTLIFPALREVVSASELAELGGRFEATEHERFGEDGFASIVHSVVALEKQLGIEALEQFTPRPG